MSRRNPSLIGIGTRRCGSSWLHRVLNSNPQVSKPPGGLHFFSDNFHRGVQWYREQLHQYDRGGFLMEFSVSYSYPEHATVVAEAIQDIFPSANLFVLVRHPIDRAYSDYLRSVRMGELPPKIGFGDAMSLMPSLVSRGQYKSNLEPFLNLFGASRLHGFLFDDLVADPRAFITRFASEFELPGSFDESVVSHVESGGKTLRLPRVAAAVRTWNGSLSAIGSAISPRAYQSLRNSGHNAYERLLDYLYRAPSVPVADFQPLVQTYEEDLAFLERTFGRRPHSLLMTAD